MNSLNNANILSKSMNGLNVITADEINTNNFNAVTLTTTNLSTNTLTTTAGITASNTQTINFGSNAPTMSGANIGTATIPDGALSSNVALKNGANQFLGVNTFWAGINATNPQTINFGTNKPTMSGANITAGTIPDGALSSNIPLKNGANSFTNTNTFTSTISTAGITSAGIDTRQVKIGTGVLQNSAVSNSDNYAIGFNTLQLASTGSTTNNAIGGYAGNNITTNSSQNVLIGHTSGGALKTNCNYNLVVGASFGSATQTGNGMSNNSVVGTNALYYAKDGCSANCAIGPYALYNDLGFGGLYSTAIGANAGVRSAGSQCVYIGGCYSQPSNVSPIYSTFNYVTCIGVDAVATASNQIVLGTSAETTYIKGNLNVTGSATLSGANINAGSIPVSSIIKNTTALNNARVCFYAPNSNANIVNANYPTGTYDVTLIGTLAGNNLDDSLGAFQAITCIGSNAYGNANQGQEIVAIGANAGGSCGNSNFCVFVGSFSGGSANHTASTFIGQGVANSMINNRFNNNIIGSGGYSATTTGDYNTGQGCGVGIANTTGSYNTAIGNYAYSNDTGYVSQNSNNCVYIGARSGNGNTASITNSVAIGYNAQVTASNTIQLGTSSETTNITGKFNINNATAGVDVLTIQKNGGGGYLYVNNTNDQIGFWNGTAHNWYINSNTGDLLLHQQYVNKGTYQSITANWSTLDANSFFYSTYSFICNATAFTTTLPTPSASNVGNEILFRRVGGTITTAVNCSPAVWIATGTTTTTTLVAGSAYIARIRCIYITASTYAWSLV